MRKTQIKGIVHDLLQFYSYEHPITYFSIPNKFTLNLLDGEICYLGKQDSVYDFYKQKGIWFKKRITKLGGKLTDFDYAHISTFGQIEKVELSYKGEKYSGTLKIVRSSKGSYTSKVNLNWINKK